MEKKVKKKTEFIEFAEREFDILEEQTSEETKKLFGELRKSCIAMCELFEEQGTIGGWKSKSILRLFAKLAAYLPLTPLQGTDDEWIEVDGDDDIMWINKRCPRVYKTRSGNAFDVQGIVFSYDGSTWFKTKDSNVEIAFPYDVPPQPAKIMLNKEEKPVS